MDKTFMDVAKSIKRQFPYARVDRVSMPSRAQMAYEASQTKARTEERKRLEGEYGRYDRARMKHSLPMDQTGLIRVEDYVERVPARSSSGKRLKLALYALRNHPDDYATLFWEDPDDPAGLRFVAKGDVSVVFYRFVTPAWAKKNKVYEPSYPMVKPVAEREEDRFRKSYLRSKKLGTYKEHSGEFINENLGCQMNFNGSPEVAAKMRESGDIQVRRDPNGNPCEYLVSKSRKHQQEQIKRFNRMQAESRDRGWQGTYSPHRGMTAVQFIRHGGLTPD